MKNVCIALCVAAAIRAWSAEPPDLTKFNNSNLAQKLQQLNIWTSTLQIARRDRKWKSDEAWNACFKRLSEISNEAPELIDPACSLFSVNGEASAECLTFCHALLKTNPLDSNFSKAILLLSSVKARDGESKQIVLSVVSKVKNPLVGYAYLASEYGGDPDVKAAVVSGLSHDTPINAAKYLPLIPLLQLNDQECNLVAAQCIELSKKEYIDGGFGSQLISVIEKSPQCFLQSITDKAQLDKISALGRNPNNSVRSAALTLLLIGFKDMREECSRLSAGIILDPNLGMKSYMAALGFIKTQKQSTTDVEALDSALPLLRTGPVSPGAASGLFSYCWRTIGDFDVTRQRWQSKLNQPRIFEPAYLSGLGTAHGNFENPETWKKNWGVAVNSEARGRDCQQEIFARLHRS
jgi:hypothetical protein